MPESPARDYFAGVLANREGHIAESIALLTRVLPKLESSEPHRAGITLQTLADDYVKSFRYKDALGAYEELLNKFASQLDKAERQSTEDDLPGGGFVEGRPGADSHIHSRRGCGDPP